MKTSPRLPPSKLPSSSDSFDADELAGFGRLAAGLGPQNALDAPTTPEHRAAPNRESTDLEVHGPELGPIERGIMNPYIPEIPKRGLPPDPHRWQPKSEGRYQRKRGGFDAKIARDGTITFEDKTVKGNPFSAMKFDLTDMAMRAAGIDPYLKEKLDMLDESRDRRATMAANVLRERLDEAVTATPQRLRSLWGRQDLTLADKKRLLFELWDECAEKGARPVVVAAVRVRRRIEAFVRKELPQGTVGGYSDHELQRLNRSRRSKALFAPYPAPQPQP